jgi:hypothetical protein
MHYPVMQFLITAMPWPRDGAISRSLLLTLSLIAVFLFAEASERRKQAWRRVIRSVSRRLYPPCPARAADAGPVRRRVPPAQ